MGTLRASWRRTWKKVMRKVTTGNFRSRKSQCRCSELWVLALLALEGWDCEGRGYVCRGGHGSAAIASLSPISCLSDVAQ
ncbi:hypothetical protein LSTR_LSTR001235 [Laodelphax striatellus]|uniref:Uncharacterized protein n=1 Tax=Laodelphax striatellus TaxID=195883 RepID=A0A482XBJ5_LAOST|nr:hypothetical protein LSTR_LSTR001235 [Laodelphax striatellus]